MTVLQAAMNPMKTQTPRLLTVMIVMSIQCTVKNIKRAKSNELHVAVSCPELRCRKRQTNVDRGRMLKSYRAPTVTSMTLVKTSHIDNVFVLELYG